VQDNDQCIKELEKEEKAEIESYSSYVRILKE